MIVIDLLSVACLIAGGAFFLTGTVGLLRFPDLYTRMHALTKVDNLGLGFLLLGLLLQADSIAAMLKLVLVWLLALIAAATVSFMIAQRACDRGMTPWRAPEDRQ